MDLKIIMEVPMKISTRTSKSAQILCIVVFFSFAFYNCDNSQAKVPAPIHSCEILTIAEVEEILGSPVEQPPRETHNEQKDLSHWMSMCNYYAPESGISAGVMIKPFPRNQKDLDAAYDAYTKELKEAMPDLDMQPVDGIAKRANWAGSLGQLTVFSDSHMYIISANFKGGTDQEKLDLAKKLATAVIAKTP
jgi:hypothetical protein